MVICHQVSVREVCPNSREVNTIRTATNGDLIFEIRVYIYIYKYVDIFINYNMMFVKVSVQELTGISETSHFLFTTISSKQLFRDARVTFHHQNVSIPMAYTATSC